MLTLPIAKYGAQNDIPNRVRVVDMTHRTVQPNPHRSFRDVHMVSGRYRIPTSFIELH